MVSSFSFSKTFLCIPLSWNHLVLKFIWWWEAADKKKRGRKFVIPNSAFTFFHFMELHEDDDVGWKPTKFVGIKQTDFGGRPVWGQALGYLVTTAPVDYLPFSV